MIKLLENVRLGINPHFFIQNMDAKNPEKKIPLMAAIKCKPSGILPGGY
jgi:hypothetical protein